jgi:acyl-CoA thioesterase-1
MKSESQIAPFLLSFLAVLAIAGCQKITNHPPKLDGPIVAFGDSLTQGIGAEDGKAYPDYLSKSLGEPVLNRGVSGDTSADGLARLQRDVLNAKPRLVVVWLGSNDAIRQSPSPGETEQNLRSIVESIQHSGAVVVLVGVPDLPFRPSYSDRIEQLAEEKGCVYIANPLKGILIDPELKSDQIHPNSRGYERVAERIAPVVKKYIAKP